MSRPTKVMCTAALIALVGATQAHAATGLSDNEVVRNETSNTVVTSQTHGTCVRTKWEAGTDVCAPPAPVVAAPAPQPVAYTRTVLSTAEKTVYFDFDSATLSENSKTQLNGVATTLKSAKDVRSADIVGYADRIGSSSYNENLSKRRAAAVKDYLASQGYLNTQVAAVRGVGESQSTTSCDSSMSREQQISCLSPDRRVEVEIQYHTTEHYAPTRY